MTSETPMSRAHGTINKMNWGKEVSGRSDRPHRKHQREETVSWSPSTTLHSASSESWKDPLQCQFAATYDSAEIYAFQMLITYKQSDFENLTSNLNSAKIWALLIHMLTLKNLDTLAAAIHNRREVFSAGWRREWLRIY